MSSTRKLSLILCLLCATFALSIFALGMVLVSGTQDVVTDLEITYSKNGNAITFVISNDCNNQEDFAQIEVNKNTKTAVVEQPANPDVLGKCFAGWYTDENLTNKIESFPVTLSAGTQLYPSYYDVAGVFDYVWNEQANGYDVYLDSDTYYYYENVYYEGLGYETVECYTKVDPFSCYLPDIYDDGIHGVGPVVNFDPTYIELDGITEFYNSPTIPINDCIISNHIQSVNFYCAYDTSELLTVILGNSVTSIGDYAFQNCSGLTNITIPNSVTSIGKYAFYNCRSLTNITIPDSVTSIGREAFYYCSSLINITIPDSVTSIGKDAFVKCNNLTYNNYDNAYYLGNDNNPYVVLIGCTSTSITTIDINTRTRMIYYEAFKDCNNLTEVTIPDSVTSIVDSTFDGCSSLSSVIIGNNVTNIGSSAFRNCSALTNISIPDSINYINELAFSGCSSLSYNSYDNAYYLGNDNNPYVVLMNSITTTITSINIHANTKIIFSSAFNQCLRLTTHIIIPNSVTQIGGSAFSNCGLTSVTLGNSIKYIETEAFLYCDNLNSIIIPDSVISIGYRAFYFCIGLTNVTIGSGVTSIGQNAFKECTNLTSAVFNNTTGWSAYNKSYGTVAVTVTSSSTSATYLRSTYASYEWTRS